MKDIEHKITIEQIQALLSGKKLVLDYAGRPQVVLYPPNYGVFIPYEEYKQILRVLGTRDLTIEELALLKLIKN